MQGLSVLEEYEQYRQNFYWRVFEFVYCVNAVMYFV